ncbi:MAG TPA: DsbA family oxidoreductase [Marmoricola sp.]|nr:DsbA family oxidoreductase [Marmoricola sp.]
MRIDIWSDVVCPWCYIGKRRLEEALAAFPHPEQVEVVYRSFELDPTAPQEGTESVVDALTRKYGAGAPQMMDRVGEVAAEAGLRFDYAHATHTRTIDAHRLLHLALDEAGPEGQRTLKEALLDAYFGHGRSMGDHAVLRDVAVEAGLPADRVDAVLRTDEYSEHVQADLAQARAYGITGVPFFVVDEKYAVSGAQPTELFTQLLERAWAESRPALEVVADGTVCGPDGCPLPT